MQVFINPDRKEWKKILQRPYADNTTVLQSVRMIIEEVKEKGDDALRVLAKKFEGIELNSLQVSAQEIERAAGELPYALRSAIQQAMKNIEAFHSRQLPSEEVIETMPGIQCWRKSIGIEKVGLYIPGGTAPLFSTVLMLAIPAYLAGCKEVILCTPCNNQGKVHDAILYAAKECGITKILKIGGAQAIAA